MLVKIRYSLDQLTSEGFKMLLDSQDRVRAKFFDGNLISQLNENTPKSETFSGEVTQVIL